MKQPQLYKRGNSAETAEARKKERLQQSTEPTLKHTYINSAIIKKSELT
jgi:hypothetical protein